MNDLNDNRVSATDGKNNTSGYVYDDFGRLWTKTNARGTVTTYTYDPDTYDLTGVSYSDGTTPSVAYEYYPNGLLKKTTDGAGVWQYTYDDEGRVHTVQVPWDASATLTHSYDGLGRVKQTDVLNGETRMFIYDINSRISQVRAGDRAFTYSYTGGNPVPDTLTRPNGSTTAYTYDGLFWLREISNRKSDNSVINGNSYNYNALGMRNTETITNGEAIASFTASTVSYTHNNVNQLVSSTGPNRTYVYDADGNMTTGYTPEGYALTCTYDAENRMMSMSYTDTSVTPGIVHTFSFTYSADNFIAKQTETVGGVSTETRFVRDNNHNTLQERDGNNNITRSYAWDPTAPGGIGGLLELTQKDTNGVMQHYNFLFDGKGNVSAVVKASDQSIAAAYSYDGFGNTIGEYKADDFAGQPYRFSTKPYYEGYGIIYYGYRFYDPIIGAWMTRDRLGEKGGLNLYGYAINNPINNLDPFGMSANSKLEDFVKRWRKCINDNYGESYEIAKNLSPFGIVSIIQDVYNGAVSAAAIEKLKSLTIEGAFKEGDICEKMAAAKKAYDAAKSLSLWSEILSTLSDITGVVSAAAAGYFIGASSYCAVCAGMQ